MATDTNTPTLELPADTRIHHATKAKAEKLMAMLAAEYPMLALVCEIEAGDTKARGWTVSHSDGVNVLEGEADIPTLADIVDAALDAGLSLEAEEEEPKASGSAVPETYRQRYREVSSNGQTNGDWLAEWLVTETNGVDGFRPDDFAQICANNGLDMTKGWALLPQSGQKGWVGRYRMNGRQVLEKVVAKVGYVIDGLHAKHVPPQDFLAALQAKHGKWLAKEAKREAAAEANAEAAAGKAA